MQRGCSVPLRLSVTVLSLGLAIGLSSCSLLSQRIPTTPHLMLGNPSDARTDLNLPNNYLMIKPQFALSYNRDRGTPNWVSWQLNKTWLGSVPRQNNFRPDPDLPEGWPKIVTSDYQGGRYDRGHMTPAADRSNTPEDNAATFVLTNILPQAAENNRGLWEDLESYCRTLVSQGKELYIISGGAGQKGTLSGKVTIPSHVWKVILVLDQPGGGAQSITEQTRVIAVDIPNDKSVANQDWRQYRTTVDAIESLTGYDFLTQVTPQIQDHLEALVDQIGQPKTGGELSGGDRPKGRPQGRPKPVPAHAR
jgi:endonuclease G, mitochondrial